MGKDGEVLDEAIKTDAKALLAQPQHVYSVLHDTMGGYSFKDLPPDYYSFRTQEERDAKLKELQADDKILWVDNNNQVLISQTQQDAAEEYVYNKLKNATTYKKKEAEFGKKEKITLELEKIQKDIDNIVARTANTEASTNLINARIKEVEGGTETDLSLNMPAIESFIRKEISGPIVAGYERGVEGWLTDKDNQITKRLQSVLGNFGVKINSQKLFKQQLELTVPKPGGTTGKVEIDIRNLSPEDIVEKVTEAVIYVPDENLEFIYNRFIKGTDDDTKTSNEDLGG